MDLIGLFSAKRLNDYESEAKHMDNFLLMQRLAPKLGIIEIITRNKTARLLGIDDDTFVSRQTLGYWVTLIDVMKIHNKVADFSRLNFANYSKYNRQAKSTMLGYKKVKICYSLILAIRNRAFHFENLYKLNPKGTPRISTRHDNIVVGIDPEKLEIFVNDVLDCLDNEIREYLQRGL